MAPGAFLQFERSFNVIEIIEFFVINVLLYYINTLNRFYDISKVEVGQHFYWQIEDFQLHAQVLVIYRFILLF